MGLISDIRRTFTALPLVTIRGNIIGNSEQTRIGPDGSFKADLLSIYDDTTVPAYLSRIQELAKYFNADIVQGVLRVLSTPMLSSIADEIVTINEGFKNTDKLNKVKDKFDELKLNEYVRDNLNYILFYGSLSIALKERKEDKDISYKIRNLVYPQVNISVMYSKEDDDEVNDVSERLVATRKGNLAVGSEDIVRIGLCDLSLYWGGYISEEQHLAKLIKDSENNEIYDDLSLRAACPLFYRIIEQLKQYVFRSRLAEIMTIRELIMPTIFTMAAQNVDQASATQLSQKIENLCNTAADSSLIISSTADLQQLYAAMMSKVKIIPDFQSVMQNNLQEFDPAKLSDKLKELIDSLPGQKEAILTALGIPVDLYEGKTTRWDTDKSAEKLNKVIKGYKDAIDKSLEDVFILLYTLMYGTEPEPGSFTVRMFESDNSAIFDNTKYNEMMTDYIKSVNELVNSPEGELNIFDLQKVAEHIKTVLINAGYEKIINNGRRD